MSLYTVNGVLLNHKAVAVICPDYFKDRETYIAMPVDSSFSNGYRSFEVEAPINGYAGFRRVGKLYLNPAIEFTFQDGAAKRILWKDAQGKQRSVDAMDVTQADFELAFKTARQRRTPQRNHTVGGSVRAAYEHGAVAVAAPVVV